MVRFIYRTINLINGHDYVGQHVGEVDDDYLGSGKLLHKAIEKYGRENFRREILCFCENEIELDEQETLYIESLNPYYNIAPGGSGYRRQKGCAWYTNGIEDKLSFVKPEGYARGRINGSPKYSSSEEHPMFGKHLSLKTKQHLSKIRKGLKYYNNGVINVRAKTCPTGFQEGMLKSSKDKMRQNNKGDGNPQFGKRWFTNGVNNKLAFECPSGYYLGRTLKRQLGV